MKKALLRAIWICTFLIGLSLLLYPTVSDWWNTRHASRAIIDYAAAWKNLTEEDHSALFQRAEIYNREIGEIAFPLMYHERVQGYEDALNVDGSGIMGYITIDKIKVQLPIYHGTSEGVLQKGVGHLAGSSLPIGGAGTHAVLSAHRGLPSARLFTDLDRVQIGDRFLLTVLDRELVYEVDQILTVEPQEVEALYCVEGEDLCTLITCTPYGVNSHRLLVRGRRVVEDTPPAFISSDAVAMPHYAAAPLLVLPFLLVWGGIAGLNVVGRRVYEKNRIASDAGGFAGTTGKGA